ncbi:hypothetical protein [Streptomyces sp. NPDC052192]|uniref:hypothetical protein n=1 Tax=Streptomyces sp. NPDC052192 TaxID=3155052 RepID=UPI00342EDAF1
MQGVRPGSIRKQIADTSHISRATVYRALSDEGDSVCVVYRSGKTKTDADGRAYDETGQGDLSEEQFDTDRKYWPLADHKRPHAKAMTYVVDGVVKRIRPIKLDLNAWKRHGSKWEIPVSVLGREPAVLVAWALSCFV